MMARKGPVGGGKLVGASEVGLEDRERVERPRWDLGRPDMLTMTWSVMG
jgi:hypothetical protein